MTVYEKWVKALRSGEYKQIKGTLKNSKGHCCLGVFLEANDHPQIDAGGQQNYDAIRASIPNYEEYYRYNDLDLKTFDEIADIVEKEYITNVG